MAIRRISIILFMALSIYVISLNVSFAQAAQQVGDGEIQDIIDTFSSFTNDVNAFTLLLIAWVLTTIIYFGGGLWERSKEQTSRKDVDERNQKNTERFQDIAERFADLAETYPERLESLENIAKKSSELIERQVNLYKIEKDSMKRGFSATLKSQKEEHGRVLESINKNFDKFIDAIGDKFSKAIIDGQVKVAQIMSDKFNEQLSMITVELSEIKDKIGTPERQINNPEDDDPKPYID